MPQDNEKLDIYAISNEGQLLLEIIRRLGGEGGSGLATEDTLQLVLTELQNQKDRELIRDRYVVETADIPNGYDVGDKLSRLSYFDISTGTSTLIDTFWFSHQNNTILSTVDINDLISLNDDELPTPGVGGNTHTSPGALPVSSAFAFDCDAVHIINKSDKDLLLTINGILGNDIKLVAGDDIGVEIAVPHITGVDITTTDALVWTGDVIVVHTRGK